MHCHSGVCQMTRTHLVKRKTWHLRCSNNKLWSQRTHVLHGVEVLCRFFFLRAPAFAFTALRFRWCMPLLSVFGLSASSRFPSCGRDRAERHYACPAGSPCTPYRFPPPPLLRFYLYNAHIHLFDAQLPLAPTSPTFWRLHNAKQHD